MKYCSYFIVFLLLLGCSKTPSVENDIKIVPIQIPVSSVAGDALALGFEISGAGMPFLVLENSFGTSIIYGTRKNEEIWFTLPYQFTQKSGACAWSLTHNQEVSTSGTIEISSSGPSAQLETYLGPRSIYAGNTDYSMLVTVPTDTYDNPLTDGTPVQIKRQNLDVFETYETETKDLISWKRLFAVEKASRMLITSSVQGNSSKERTVDVYPSQATGFELYSNRNHEYADGNQIITYETSVIRDIYNNTISDGTLVTFQVTNKNGIKLRTQGTTINGVARAQMLHPDEEDVWQVAAYVTGAAKSNVELIAFKPAILDYDLQISEDNRTIQVGPLYSFMKQLIPDGMPIQLLIHAENNIQPEIQTTSSVSGSATFELTYEQFKEGAYHIEVQIAGITKKQTLQLHEK